MSLHVISIDQPYASLIMAGIKGWETRGCPPNGDMRPEGVRGLPGKQINRGDRIGIAATKQKRDVSEIGFEPWAPLVRPNDPGRLKEPVVFGAILGTVEVVGALPIREWTTCTLDASERHICRDSRLLLLIDHERGDSDIDDQLPFGNWVPGGWAWELANPIPTTKQCPACDGSGWILDCDACRESGKSLADTDCSASGCRVCGRDGSCPPIPVKGKQGVWEWTP